MRLTKQIREEIISKAMHQAFDARENAHDKATTALADAIYNHEFGAAEKIAKKLPNGWLNKLKGFRIAAAGFSWRSRSDGKKSDYLEMSVSRLMPEHGRHNEIKIGGAHPLNDQAQNVAEEYAAIQRDKEALRVKLESLVYSVTTTDKLLEAWPEAKKFIPTEAVKVSTALVPVELVPQINAALNAGGKPAKKP